MGYAFISYSHKDVLLMRGLRDDLRAEGLKLWIDNQNLELGNESWTSDVERAIEISDCLVVILTPNAKTSLWIKRELQHAQRHDIKILPLLARGSEKDSIPLILGDHQFVDIRTDYDSGLNNLIGAIKKEIKSKSAVRRRNRNKRKTFPSGSIEKQTNTAASPIVMMLDRATDKQLRYALAHGKPATFIGKVTFTDQAIDELRITLIPPGRRSKVKLKPLNWHIAYLDDRGKSLFEAYSVTMKPSQINDIIKWTGKPLYQDLIFYLSYNPLSRLISFQMSFDDKERNPADLHWYFQILDKLPKARQVRFTDVDTGQVHIIPISEEFSNQIPEVWRRLVDAMATIAEVTGIVIPVPANCTYRELWDAEMIQEVLQTGITKELTTMPEPPEPNLSLISTVTETITGARKLLDAFEQDKVMHISMQPIYPIVRTLLGYEIQLGNAQQVAVSSQLLNEAAIREFLARNDLQEDNGIYLHFAVDKEKSYFQFADWPKDK